LVELLIVIVIIGILATFLMANFVGVRQRARDAQRKSDMRQIQSALELYRADQGSYPVLLPTCGASFCFPEDCGAGAATYITRLPCDPQTNTVYTYAPASGGYTLQATLENSQDSQRDDLDCTSSCTYTLQNP
jgi:general secretion pathway protein G